MDRKHWTYVMELISCILQMSLFLERVYKGFVCYPVHLISQYSMFKLIKCLRFHINRNKEVNRRMRGVWGWEAGAV